MANLVTRTETLNDTGVWTANAVVTANTHAAPAFATASASGADTVNDNSGATQLDLIGAWYDIPANTNEYVGSVFIRKDAITDRWPQVILRINGVIESYIDINTSTGASAVNPNGNTPIDSGVVDVDANWWRLWVRIANNGSGVQIRMSTFPSRVDALGGNLGAGATGSAVYWGFNITQSSTLLSYDPEPAYSTANLVTSTEALDDTGVWTNNDITLTANTHAAPAFAGINAGMADTVADNTAVVQASLAGTYYDIPADTSDYVGSVFIRKDAVTGRWPLFALQISGVDVGFVSINTSTGASADDPTDPPVASGVVDVDANWWRLWLRIANNGSGTAIRVAANPSVLDSLGGSRGAGFTGSCVMWGFNITNTSTLQAYQPQPSYGFVVQDAKLIIRAS